MTYSIVARDPATGHLGVAVASRFFAVGGIVPHIRGGVGAVATQSFVNPLNGVDGLAMLAEGKAAADIVAVLAERDAGRDQRQFHLIDAAGRQRGLYRRETASTGPGISSPRTSRSPATCWPARK